MYQTYQLSHSEAAEIIDVIRKRIEEYGQGASVAVVDSHGELLAFLRTDNCRPSVINIAINKAFSASREWTESGNIGRSARENGYPITNFGDLRYTGWDGGFPVRYDGQVIAGVGVSGLSDDIDLELARIGAEMFEII